MTLLEAIAKAGDITPNGKIKNVKVIREVDGKRIVLEHDLTSAEVFNSPFYYLCQTTSYMSNRNIRIKIMKNRGWQITTLIVSIASVITSLLWVLK